MRKRLVLAIALLCLVHPVTSFAKDRFLQGRVLLVGEQDELKPAVGQDLTLVESGDAARTKEGGRFRLFLKEIFKPGSRITLSLEKTGWRIQYPLDGEARVPDDPEKELVEVRLLSVGSKKFWSDDRIEKFIRDTAEKSKEQVRPQGKPQEIDFSRYIKDWAVKYGFNALQAKDQIDKWVAEAEQKNDPYQLGLAAYAKKNFGEAGKLFEESAVGKVRRAHEASITAQRLTEEGIRDYRLAGDAHTNNYQFAQALIAYQSAKDLVSRKDRPRLWADLTIIIGTAETEIGIHTKGDSIHHHLENALTAYREALLVYTKEGFLQDWARVQMNLGRTLSAQSWRIKGKESERLFAESVAAYHEALTVFTKALFPQDWARVQMNLGRTFWDQGRRAEGKESERLFAESVAAYHEALTVFTKALFPQDWASTQMYLGRTLAGQALQAKDKDNDRLFAESVAAYREALTVFTKALFPQDWALTQMHLGNTLADQALQAKDKESDRLLAEAVAAYHEALTVYTEEHSPQQWARTQNNLSAVQRYQEIRTSNKADKELSSSPMSWPWR